MLGEERLHPGADATALDADTATTLAAAIRGSTDAANGLVRDVVANTVSGGSCTSESDGVSAIGARVDVDGVCWEHVHPELYSVYDFTHWSGVRMPGSDRRPCALTARR